MTNQITTLSRQRLEALIDDEDCRATVEEQEAMADFMLAVMDAKPMGFISERDGPVLYGAHISLSPGTHFYTTPPAPSAPDGWKLVPVEPTETMVIRGFESAASPIFSEPEEWAKYESMSGCQQAAYKARLCWAAMLAAAPGGE